MSTIAALATRKIVRASPDDTVQDAIEMMCEHNVGAVLIMSGGSIDSIFTERDVVRRVLAAGLEPRKTSLREVATSSPATVVETASVRECAALIRDKRFRHVPVVSEQGELVGMISSRDFLSQLAGGFEKAILKARAGRDTDEVEDYYRYVVGNFVD